MRKLFFCLMIFRGFLMSVTGEVEFEINSGDGKPICEIIVPASEVDGEKSEGRVLELRTYHAAPGRLDELLNRFRDHTAELFTKHGMKNVGYWVPVDNKDNLLIYLLAYPDKKERDASWKALAEDPEWKKVVAESEAGGKLVEKVDRIFLKPTDFSEGFAVLGEGKEHLFEMRTYTAVSGKLPNLHARFRDHTMALFRKHGMINLAYFQPTAEESGAENTLLYFIAHKDMESAAKSWKEFREDPDWIVAKKASEEAAGGSLTAEDGVKSIFLKAVDFSPVR